MASFPGLSAPRSGRSLFAGIGRVSETMRPLLDIVELIDDYITWFSGDR